MAEKILKAKVAHKIELEADWLQSSYVPQKGEIVVFAKEIGPNGETLKLPEGRTEPYRYDRFKVGDGNETNVNELPFSFIGVDWKAEETDNGFIKDKPPISGDENNTAITSKIIGIYGEGGDFSSDVHLSVNNSYGSSGVDLHVDEGGVTYIDIDSGWDNGDYKTNAHFGNDGISLSYNEDEGQQKGSSVKIKENNIDINNYAGDNNSDIDISAENSLGESGIHFSVSGGASHSVKIITDDTNMDRWGIITLDTSSGTVVSYSDSQTSDGTTSNLVLNPNAASLKTSNGYGYAGIREEVTGGGGSEVIIRADEDQCGAGHYGEAEFSTSGVSLTHNTADNFKSELILNNGVVNIEGEAEAGASRISIGNGQVESHAQEIYLEGGDVWPGSIRISDNNIELNASTGTISIHGTLDADIPADRITGTISQENLPSYDQPDQNQTDTEAKDYIKNKIPFEKGESETSIQQIGNTAISPGTISMGANSVAGSKCYYIRGIDFNNKQIYLSKTQTDLRPTLYRIPERIDGSFDIRISGNFKSNGQTFSELYYNDAGDPASIYYDNLNVCDSANGFNAINPEYETVEIDTANTSNELISFLETYCTPISSNGNLTIDSDIANNGILEEIRNAVVGKYISIRNARHYEFLATVVSLTEDGILTYDGTLGFTKFICLETDGVPKPDEWTVRIPEVADFGEVILSKVEGQDAAATNGSDCHAAGIDSFAINTNNISGGYYSFTSGRDNMTGYGGFSTGRNNKSMCLYSFTNGIGNIAGYNPNHTANEILANLTADYLYYAYNHAEGQNTKAVRRAAHSQGIGSIASGLASFAGGTGCEASGDYSTALGTSAKAKGTNAAVFGNGCEATGFNALVAGLTNKVYGHHGFAVGRENNVLSGANYSAVFGYNNDVGGIAAVAFGQGNTSSAENSATFGVNNIVTGVNSFAAGNGNIVNAKDSFAIGQGNKILAATSNGKTYGTCFVSGTGNTADGGYNTTLGGRCENYGLYSITNGLQCKEYANHAIVSGRQSIINSNAHYSLNIGYANISNHHSTLAAGRGLVTGRTSQAVLGEFNEIVSDAVLVVGNGDCTIANDGTVSGTRSNAMVVKKNGDVVASGKIIDGDGNILGKTTEVYGNEPILPSIAQAYTDIEIPIRIRVRNNEINWEGTGNVPFYVYFDRVITFSESNQMADYSETFTVKDYGNGGSEQEYSYTISIHGEREHQGGWTVTNNSDGVVTFLVDEITLEGTGSILTKKSDNFSVINDWTTNNQPAIKIGNTILTETKLKKLLDFIDTIEG